MPKTVPWPALTRGDEIAENADTTAGCCPERAIRESRRLTKKGAPLYRFLKQRGLSEKQLLAPQPRKKFEAEHSNQIWQSDMLYGPYVRRPGGGKMQAILHTILDDASRLIPHAQFYCLKARFRLICGKARWEAIDRCCP